MPPDLPNYPYDFFGHVSSLHTQYSMVPFCRLPPPPQTNCRNNPALYWTWSAIVCHNDGFDKATWLIDYVKNSLLRFSKIGEIRPNCFV